MNKPRHDLIGRQERKHLLQLDHLADTAWRLFESEGYEAVTMERIAEAADVAKGTLYKHFPAKEVLLRQQFHREMRERQGKLMHALSTLPAGRVRLSRFLALSTDWPQRRRAYLLPYVTYRMAEPIQPQAQERRSGMGQVFTQLVGEGQAAGGIRTDVNAGVLAVYLEFLFLAELLRWLTDATPDLGTELECMLDLFLSGVEIKP